MAPDAFVLTRAHRDTGDDTKGQILAVALKLIAEQGFAATSTRAIADWLKLTKAAIYYHFRTKDDLLTALISPIERGLHHLVQEPFDPSVASRRAIVGRYIDLVAGHEELIRVLSRDPSVAHRPAAKSVQPLYASLTELLCGKPNPQTAGRAQVRASLGAIHAVFVYADHDDDRALLWATAFESACRILEL